MNEQDNNKQGNGGGVKLRVTNDTTLQIIKMSFGKQISDMQLSPYEAIGVASILLQNALAILGAAIAAQTQAQEDPNPKPKLQG